MSIMDMVKNKLWLNSLVIFISLGGAAICARLLYVDIYISKSSMAGLAEAGYIKEKTETVKRKFSENMLWDLIGKDEKLYWNDSIQTAPRSQVTIALTEGGEIKLGASSLVVLEKDNDKIALNLKSGQLVVENKNSKTQGIKVNGIDLQSEQGKTLALNVDEKLGQLTATTTSDDGSGKQIVINKDGTVEEKEIPAVLNAPAALTRMAIDEDEKKISFAWTSKNEKTVLEISKNQNFSSTVLSREIKGGSYDYELDPGFYFWRVKVGTGDKALLSEVRTIDLVKMVKPEILGPSKNRFTFAVDMPSVEFSWKPSAFSSGYVLEASADKEFKEMIFQQETTATSLKSSKLKEGKVYWRVSALYGSEKKSSAVAEFEITKLDEIPAPVLLTTKSEFNLVEEGVKLQWKPVDGAKEYRVKIVRVEAGKETVLADESQTKLEHFKKELADGDYKWVVTSIDDYGRESKPNQKSFKVIHEEAMDAPEFEMSGVQ